jgi:hypothetical protein
MDHRLWRRAGVAAIVCLICGTPLAAAPKKANSKSAPKSPVAQAKERLETAKRDYAGAVGRVQAAKMALEHNQQQAGETRKAVHQDHDSTATLQAARSASEDARKSLEEKKRPLLAAVHDQPEYRKAVAQRDALQQKLKNLPPDIDKQDRKALEHELALAMARVRQLEKAGLESDPSAKGLLDDLSQAEAALQELVRERDTAIANDPRIASSLQAIERAKTDLAMAQQAATMQANMLAAAERDYAQKNAAEQAKHQKKKSGGKHKGGKKKK